MVDRTAQGDASETKLVGKGLFDKENYIDPVVGYNFCVVEDGANFEIQAVYIEDKTCMLTLDDSGIIDESGC